MTRTLGALAAHVAGKAHKLCYMLRLDLTDGTSMGFTDHDNVISWNLGDGAIDYNPGINISDVTLAAGLESSNFEASGPIDTVTRLHVLGGRYRNAVARLFMVNWQVQTAAAAIMRGKVGACRVEGDWFTFEVRNAGDMFNQTQGGVLTPYCRTYFGSTQCGVVRTAYPGEITAVGSPMKFTVDHADADYFFNFGNVKFTTGDLTGVEEAKILSFVGGEVELFEPLLKEPEVGDTVILYRGCSKLIKSEDATMPTCVSYDNGVNFRGHPQVPGSRFYMKVSAPGSSYA